MKYKNFQVQRLAWGFLIVLLAGISSVNLFSQTETTAKKQRARISLDFIKINNEEQQLVATVKTRVEGYFQNVNDAEILFFRDVVTTPENLLGKARTDAHGMAILSLPKEADSTLWTTYIAVLENHPNFRNEKREIAIRKGNMLVDLEVVDSLKMIKVFVGTPDSAGNVIPVEDVNARAYVKRLFGLLPISDELESTDEYGQLNITFPPDMPGDENGNITVYVKVEDHDDFGNLEFRKKISWGDPIMLDKSELEKDLWLSSANTPTVFVWMVNLMLLGVLGVIVYILIQLFRISKLGLIESSE